MSQATLSQGPYRNSNLFSGYYLDEHVYELDAWDCDAEAREAFEALSDLYETRKDALSSYDEAPLRNHWIDKVLEEMGYETLEETPLVDARGSIDRTLYDTEDDQMTAAVMKADGEHTEMYGQSLSILEAKQWDADFTERFSDQRSYRDASHQIKSYLEHTPESVSWGILTNGKKWRLYGTNDYETETYYEIDLPELLESGSVEVFKYFYVFFRPAAFRESTGTTFLDTVWSESEIAAQELGEDLQDNVFTALRVLGEGFVEANDLAIDPSDDERLGELKQQSLVLLYRLMFVLYAESRGLIDPEDPNRRSEYEENFSLGVLRQDIREKVGETPDEAAFEREYSEYSFSMWNRLERLFSLVDTGNDDLGIPPYNGGLFDAEQHEFLIEHEVANTYIAEVIYRLSTTKTDDGFVPADYADLDTRHLGTIYEGLLEHEFAVAPEAQAAVAGDGGQVWKPADEVSVAEAVETVEEGELYVVNDEGERKATGAYYTPDYVVTYIVEETVGPLLSDIEAELAEMDMEPGTQEYVVAFWERVTDLKILDPAMGSGHFLTKATGYLADAVMEQVRELETGTLFDEEQVRREISKECIYGVDINGMAVELAKLSMWLETLAADQPLAFLDHHLKSGNSLVGSDITTVLAEDEGESGQVTLAYDFAQTRQRALDHVMDLTGELLAIDNETLEDIHSMEDLYDDIRADPLYQRLFTMATVHTASQFGLDVPGDADKRMARAIEDEDDWADIKATDWCRAARAMADDEDFFHWELEFPEIFFDGDGERIDSAGFDAVVGNPPYVRVQRIHQEFTQYLFAEYESCSSRTDLSIPFIESAINLLSENGNAAYISTSQWLSTDYGHDARGLFSSGKIRKVVDFNTLPVFDGISTYPAVFVMTGGQSEVLEYAEVTEESDLNIGAIQSLEFRDVGYEQLDESAWVLDELDLRSLLQERAPTEPLSEFGHFHIGAITGADDVFVVAENTVQEKDLEKDLIYPYAHRNNEISRYGTVNPDDLLIYPYKSADGDSDLLPEPTLKEKYPNIYSHLQSHKQALTERKDSRQYYAQGSDWYRFLRSGRFDYIRPQKLLFRGLAERTRVGWLREDTVFSGNNCPGFISESGEYSDEYLLTLLNSTLISEYLVQISPAKMQDYSRFNANDLNEAPIRAIDFSEENSSVKARVQTQYEEFLAEGNGELAKQITDTLSESSLVIHNFITEIASELTDFVDSRESLNLNLFDYLGTYADGPTLGEMGYQPPSGLSSSVLTETAESTAFETLRVTAARIERDGRDVRVLVVPYVKPTDGEEYETNSRGYATLAPVPAMEFVGLDDAQADLIEAFVPHAVAEEDGDYHDNATKTISPLDRLEGLTLPKLADVEGGIERYMDARERAAELDEQIERTDELIDEIVYELYGLTDEEVEIVEEAVRN